VTKFLVVIVGIVIHFAGEFKNSGLAAALQAFADGGIDGVFLGLELADTDELFDGNVIQI
jgi:hypothetical protein